MALTGILLSGDPGQQASVAVAVLFMSYVAQQRLQPFLEVDGNQVDDSGDAGGDELEGTEQRPGGAPTRVVVLRRRLLAFLRRRFRMSTAAISSNTLESAFLVAAMLVLMAGMVFISGGFAAGSVGYTVLTWVVAVVIVLSTCGFVALVVFEVYKSIAHHKREVAHRRIWRVPSRPCLISKVFQVAFYCDDKARNP